MDQGLIFADVTDVTDISYGLTTTIEGATHLVGPMVLRDLGLGEGSGGALVAIAATVTTGTPLGTSVRWNPAGSDFDAAYVFAGTMRVRIDASRTIDLSPGDCLQHRPGCQCVLSDFSADFELVILRAPARENPDAAPISTQDCEAAAREQVGSVSQCRVYLDVDEAYVKGNGPRSYFEYRDLGAAELTDGRLHLHVVRATGQASSDGGTAWHTHTMAQWYMVLRGEGNIDVKENGRSQLRAGDCMTIGKQMPHDEFRYSSDYAVVQLCSPAVYDTANVSAP